MSFLNVIANSIFLPTMDLMFGLKIKKFLDFLNISQYWSKNELEAFQLERLKILISYVYENVPYYRKIMKSNKLIPDDFKNINDIAKFPIQTKENIRKGIREGSLISTSIDNSKLIYSSSSGSTGEPLQFYIDKVCNSINKATGIRAWQWMGFELGDKILRINYLPRDNIKKRLQDKFSNNRYIQINILDKKEIHNIIKNLNTFKPKVLRCYPEPLYRIAKYIQENYIDIVNIPIVSTTGSKIFNHQRELIEQVFKAELFDGYSCEGGSIISECEKHSYHSAMEYAITEIVDENDYPTKKGRHITTDLWNMACPFIRYDSGDILFLTDEKCLCGRELLRIEEVFGRESEVIITPDKNNLYVPAIVGFMQDYKGVDQFQLVQIDFDKIIMKLKINDKYNSSEESDILSLINSLIGGKMTIKIEYVDCIPLLHNGKPQIIENQYIKSNKKNHI